MLAPRWQYRLLGRVQVPIPSAGPVLGTISTLVFGKANVVLGTSTFFVQGVGASLPMMAVAYAGK